MSRKDPCLPEDMGSSRQPVFVTQDIPEDTLVNCLYQKWPEMKQSGWPWKQSGWPWNTLDPVSPLSWRNINPSPYYVGFNWEEDELHRMSTNLNESFSAPTLDGLVSSSPGLRLNCRSMIGPCRSCKIWPSGGSTDLVQISTMDWSWGRMKAGETVWRIITRIWNGAINSFPFIFLYNFTEILHKIGQLRWFLVLMQ